MIKKDRLVKLLQELIHIDSQNPSGNEKAIALFVKDIFLSLGFKVRLYEFAKNRTNLVAVLKGSKSKHSLLLTPHLDTVPAGRNWKNDPFAGKIVSGKIYGLGATDCKGNLAVAIEALRSLVEDKVSLGYDLVIAATANEESGSQLGLIPLLERGILDVDAALVLDADDFEIVVAQKGLMHLKVKIKGKRGHGAYPWLGINAIDIASEIINALKNQRGKYPRNTRPNRIGRCAPLRSKYLYGPTVNVGTIHGGDKVNVVADWCDFELDFRFLPKESAKNILSDLKRTIKKVTGKFSRDSGIPLTAGKIEIEGIQDPYCISPSHELVRSLVSAMKRENIKPRLHGSEGATVITFFQDKNIPATATGFGVEGCAHTIDEYAKVDSLYKGALVLERFIKEYKFN